MTKIRSYPKAIRLPPCEPVNRQAHSQASKSAVVSHSNAGQAHSQASKIITIPHQAHLRTSKVAAKTKLGRQVHPPVSAIIPPEITTSPSESISGKVWILHYRVPLGHPNKKPYTGEYMEDTIKFQSEKDLIKFYREQHNKRYWFGNYCNILPEQK